jgi:SAM-dependent methyltransferase
MPTDSEHADYFADQERSTREFWNRFGQRPRVRNRSILDIGCGHGAMSVGLAKEGAKVLGVDIDGERIDWARRNVARRHPDLVDHLRFETLDSTSLSSSRRFDIAVCKDTMEHIEDVPATLRDLRTRLEPGGQFWVGFSPLYYSPFGDHGRTGLRVPWAHAALPQDVVCRLASRIKGFPIRHLGDIELNGLTAGQFESYVLSSDMYFHSIAYNCGDRPLLRVMDWARRVPGLERYMTVSIYAVLVPRIGIRHASSMCPR